MAVTSIDEPPAQALEILRSTFGFQSFRPYQAEIIGALLDGRDVFAVMPTGGGKSLCYQLPACANSGTCVVISPLISLMKDQVDTAQANGICAEYLNSSLAPAEARSVVRRLRAGELDLLYAAPERFNLEGFQDTLRGIDIAMFAVDEAHCISEWGHDFRPDYLGLSRIAQLFPEAPIAAFTATATRQVQDDIARKLGLRGAFTVRASFDRPNLIYRVANKSIAEYQIMQFVKEHPDQSGIVYRTTRADVEKTAAYLRENGVQALPYHAGLDSETRRACQERFNCDEVRVIVATIAFGMGIDKSNIRFVVHGDLPKNIESYYQETGRAGRDGALAECLLLFSPGDIPKIRFFIGKIEDDAERQAAERKLRRMGDYAGACRCRRAQILDYFGEKYPHDNCGGCDVCCGDVELEEATTQAQIFLSAVARTGQRFGAGHVVDVVRGADTERVRRLDHGRIKTFGRGSDKPKRYWRALAADLLSQGQLRQVGDRYPTLEITAQGWELLRGNARFRTLKRDATKQKPRRTQVPPAENVALFDELRELRMNCARQRGVPPFVVFSDRTLHEMCRALPMTQCELSDINGVGQHKLAEYGALFLEVIRGYVDGSAETHEED